MYPPPLPRQRGVILLITPLGSTRPPSIPLFFFPLPTTGNVFPPFFLRRMGEIPPFFRSPFLSTFSSLFRTWDRGPFFPNCPQSTAVQFRASPKEIPLFFPFFTLVIAPLFSPLQRENPLILTELRRPFLKKGSGPPLGVMFLPGATLLH